MLSKFSTRSKIIILSIILGIMAGLLDSLIDAIFFYNDHIFDQIIHPSNFEIYIRSFLLIIFLLFGIVTSMILELKQTKRIQEKTLTELKKVQEEVAVLERFLPICASCKKIRDENGNWHQIESYFADHSGAKFSHSICQDCAKKLYPDIVDENGEIKK